MWRFDLQGDVFQSFSPLYVLAHIVDNSDVPPTDYLKVNMPNISQIADRPVLG